MLSIMKYCAVLYSGQTEKTKSLFHVSVMNIYRYILNDQTFRVSCKEISKRIGLDLPREILAKCSVLFVHRIHKSYKPRCLFRMFRYPIRSLKTCHPTINDLPRTQRARRGALTTSIELFKWVDANIISLQHNEFKKIVNCRKFQVLSEREQYNWN